MNAGRAKTLPRHARLSTPAEYGRVFQQPIRVGDSVFTLLARPPADGLTPERAARLGLAISKKCAKKAVDRNRIKRVVRESFRRIRHQLPAMDIVVMCRPMAATLPNQALFESLDRLWERMVRQCVHC